MPQGIEVQGFLTFTARNPATERLGSLSGLLLRPLVSHGSQSSGFFQSFDSLRLSGFRLPASADPKVFRFCGQDQGKMD